MPMHTAMTSMAVPGFLYGQVKTATVFSKGSDLDLQNKEKSTLGLKAFYFNLEHIYTIN